MVTWKELSLIKELTDIKQDIKLNTLRHACIIDTEAVKRVVSMYPRYDYDIWVIEVTHLVNNLLRHVNTEAAKFPRQYHPPYDAVVELLNGEVVAHYAPFLAPDVAIFANLGTFETFLQTRGPLDKNYFAFGLTPTGEVEMTEGKGQAIQKIAVAQEAPQASPPSKPDVTILAQPQIRTEKEPLDSSQIVLTEKSQGVPRRLNPEEIKKIVEILERQRTGGVVKLSEKAWLGRLDEKELARVRAMLAARTTST